MRRRALLATVGTTTLAGCAAGLPTICSRPSLRADRLEFETDRLRSISRWVGQEDAALATQPAHVSRFEPPEEFAAETDAELVDEDRAVLEETAFEEAFVVGIIVGSSGQSSDARVTHVVREDDRVHCYICIRRRGMTDDWAPQSRLVRVDSSWEPETVRVTFTNGQDGTQTFDSDGTFEPVGGF
ncbi:hypothetical protein [Natrarchaeobius chitinivorans]|uniref:Lipoprotein n=1 Tax=Natrarchaeobius chitinivorans TaxID=1679083 RepID=A0A3N6N7R2_NATCH|nr:hypothetical protein [Natrarchaeobius chitinivorans]RQG94422.1 hypothetical protein EA473_12020 [Natrarchaeobius chitinivorans]